MERKLLTSLFQKGLFLNGLLKTKVYKFLIKKVLPFVRFSTYYSDIRGFKYHQGYNLLKPGHIILSVDKKKLLTILIPGEFSHAAFCVSKGDYRYFEIAEMTNKNYTESYFYDICKEADRVVILECTDFDQEYIEKMINNCLSMQGSDYDTYFSFGEDSLYCSELLYHTDFEKRVDLKLEYIKPIARYYVSPDSYFKAKNIKIIWDSSKV